MEFDLEFDDALISPPITRAAYSDRTAWLMSVMSLLAYIPFEGPPSDGALRKVAEALSGSGDIDTIIGELRKLTRGASTADGAVLLKTQLGRLGFELIKTFSVSAGLQSDTQAYIARISLPEETLGKAQDMLVLAFRGTEPRRLADLKTDLDAHMVTVRGVETHPAKVHRGFYNAFESVKGDINAILRRPEYKGLPVYVTGHSLGGALALVATRFIANQSLGACYTFGGPRVCNEVFSDQVFTPVYRIMNASDVVPKVPPDKLIVGPLLWGMKFLPAWARPEWLQNWIRNRSEYRHYGDMRHLSKAAEMIDEQGVATYPKMRLRSAPHLFERWSLLGWKSPLTDHGIELYEKKLRYYARRRSLQKSTLNPRAPGAPNEAPEPIRGAEPAEKPGTAP